MLLILVEECSSNRVDELVSKSEDKQATSKTSMPLNLGCARSPKLVWVFLLEII